MSIGLDLEFERVPLSSGILGEAEMCPYPSTCAAFDRARAPLLPLLVVLDPTSATSVSVNYVQESPGNSSV